MHDVPLIGTFQQDGDRHGFACLRGELEDVGLWVLAPILNLAEGVELEITGFESPRAAYDAFKTATFGSPFVLALSVENEIAFYNDYAAGDDLRTSMKDFMDSLGALSEERRRHEYVMEHREDITAALTG